MEMQRLALWTGEGLPLQGPGLTCLAAFLSLSVYRPQCLCLQRCSQNPNLPSWRGVAETGQYTFTAGEQARMILGFSSGPLRHWSGPLTQTGALLPALAAIGAMLASPPALAPRSARSPMTLSATSSEAVREGLTLGAQWASPVPPDLCNLPPSAHQGWVCRTCIWQGRGQRPQRLRASGLATSWFGSAQAPTASTSLHLLPPWLGMACMDLLRPYPALAALLSLLQLHGLPRCSSQLLEDLGIN